MPRHPQVIAPEDEDPIGRRKIVIQPVIVPQNQCSSEMIRMHVFSEDDYKALPAGSAEPPARRST